MRLRHSGHLGGRRLTRSEISRRSRSNARVAQRHHVHAALPIHLRAPRVGRALDLRGRPGAKLDRGHVSPAATLFLDREVNGLLARAPC